jgi:hypothetical protein
MPLDEDGFGSPLSSPRSPQEVESRRRKQAIFRKHMALRQGRTAQLQCEEQQEQEGKLPEKIESIAFVSADAVKPEPRSKSTGRLARKHRLTVAPFERAVAAPVQTTIEKANSESSLANTQSNLCAPRTTGRAAGPLASQSRRRIEIVKKLAEKKCFTRSEPSTPERVNRSDELSAQKNEAEKQRAASAPRPRTDGTVMSWSQRHDNVSDSFNELSVSMETNEDKDDAVISESILQLNLDADLDKTCSGMAVDRRQIANVNDEKIIISESDPHFFVDSESSQILDTNATSIVGSERPDIPANQTQITTELTRANVTFVEPGMTDSYSGKSASLVDYVSLNDSNVDSSVGPSKLDVLDSGHAPFDEEDRTDAGPLRGNLDVTQLRVVTNLTTSDKPASVVSNEELCSPSSKSRCYDMRSVHDDFDDPSWDISKIAFTVSSDEGRKHDDYDIFDTASWAGASEVTFGTPRGVQPNSYTYDQRADEEEKKENNSVLESSPDVLVGSDTQENVQTNGRNLNAAVRDELEHLREKETLAFKQYKTTDESPTWDAAKVMFPIVLGKTTIENDSINMFDTASWAPSSLGPSNWSETRVELHPDIEAEVSRLMNEGTVAADNDAEQDQGALALPNTDKDDVPLLDEEETRSDIADELQTLAMRLLGKLGNPAKSKERLQAYIAQDIKDLSSVEEDSEEEPDNESENSSTIDQVLYLEHGEDDGNSREPIVSLLQETLSNADRPESSVQENLSHIDDKEVQGDEALLLFDNREAPLIEQYPTFDPSVAAFIDLTQTSDQIPDGPITTGAKKSGDRARPSPENPPINSFKRCMERTQKLVVPIDKATSNELCSEILALAVPPPPPPPPPGSKRSRSGTKKKKQRYTDANGFCEIPKIAPPPEEKLRKWEESKRSPRSNVASVGNIGNAAKSTEIQGKMESETWHQSLNFQEELSPVHAARARALESALKRVGNRSKAEGDNDSVHGKINGEETLSLNLQRHDIIVDSSLKDSLTSETVQRPLDTPECFQRSPDSVQHATETLEGEPGPSDKGASALEVPQTVPGFEELLEIPEGSPTAPDATIQSREGRMLVGEESHDTRDGSVGDHLDDEQAMENTVHDSSNISDKDRKLEPCFSVLLAHHGRPKSKSPYKSVERGSPQVSVHDLAVGTKMAEKLALASSAAAQKFEEQFVSRSQVDLKHLGENESKQQSAKAGNSRIDSVSALSLFCVPQTMDEEDLNVTVGAVGIIDTSKLGPDSIVDVSDSLGKPPLRQDNASTQGFDSSVELSRGAFSPWRNIKRGDTPPAIANGLTDKSLDNNALETQSSNAPLQRNAHSWLLLDVLKLELDNFSTLGDDEVRRLLYDNDNFNALCMFVAGYVNDCQTLVDRISPSGDNTTTALADRSRQKPKLQPFRVPPRNESSTGTDSPSVLAANFVSFLYRVEKVTGTPSPFGQENPFLREIIGSSMRRSNDTHGADAIDDRKSASMQDILFDHVQGHPGQIIEFFFRVCHRTSPQATESEFTRGKVESSIEDNTETGPEDAVTQGDNLYTPSPVELSLRNLNLIVSSQRPSPFETAVWTNPSFLLSTLAFLGDPVAVCRMKVVNRFCNRIIKENEHVVMRDAVRLGGLSMHLRPSFWMWVTLEKCGQHEKRPFEAQLSPVTNGADHESPTCVEGDSKVRELERMGRTGKWHSVIDRDVSRAFGNMPPHKTGARLRTDSIVRALVTWGRNRIMKRGVRGSGEGPWLSGAANTDKMKNTITGDEASDASETSHTPTDTVSDWGGVSPVGSFTSSVSGMNDGDSDRQKSHGFDKLQHSADVSMAMRGPHQMLSTRSRQSFVADEDLALGGNALTEEMKTELQDKLGYILYALAAAHQDVGYCQGMDYVVAHLLRILQDTILWRAARGTLPLSITSASAISFQNGVATNVGDTQVVEETVFKVMDTFFTTYNLRHMYWPELRCLKTCCRVFERLIQIKLPVLADHFEHHDLNVGLFALGWFQTLFLYLPSMPSATVCHMWDIWLVERSFKIFFRVGTAILFLSQPILLNHDLEGMMTYLNTFPDATLLNPDILIACALQIKVTNKMLMEIEAEITGGM